MLNKTNITMEEKIKDETTKDLFQDVPVELRAQMLQDNCYSHEETTVTRHYGDDEIVELKNRLSESSVELAKLSAEKTRIVKDYDAKMKPHKLEVAETTMGLRERSYNSEEEVYLMDNQTEGTMDVYDVQGKFLYSRRLYEKERQKNIFSMDGAKKAG